MGSTQWYSFLRHCAISWKVLGLIPDGVIGIFHWRHWNFSLAQSFWLHCGPGIDSASNRNEYQEYFLGSKDSWCIGPTTLPLSCANCQEIWELQASGTLRACTEIALLLCWVMRPDTTGYKPNIFIDLTYLLSVILFTYKTKFKNPWYFI